MTIHVHAVMENAHYLYVTIGCAIEDHVPTDTALAISFADCIARTP